MEHNNALMTQLVQQLTMMLQLVIVGAVVGGISTLLTMFNAWMAKRNAAALKRTQELVTDNTVVTKAKAEAICSKVESATNDAYATATEATKVAKSVAIQNVVATKRVLEETQDIKKQLNGGPDGLGNRVTKNETRLEGLERGQAIQGKAIEGQGKMIEGIARHVENLTLSFSAFVEEYKKNHKHED